MNLFASRTKLNGMQNSLMKEIVENKIYENKVKSIEMWAKQIEEKISKYKQYYSMYTSNVKEKYGKTQSGRSFKLDFLAKEKME